MNFHTFGSKENKVIVLIHGMLTPWQMWEEAINYFSANYYVVVPELDAHTQKEPSTFKTVEEEARLIKEYILENHNGKVYMICGLSMGGRIAAILAGTKGISTDYLVLDGAPLKKISAVLISVMKKNYISIIKKSKRRDPKLIYDFKIKFLPERYLEPYLKIADNMKKQSVINISDSVFSEFECPVYSERMKILFMHGTKANELISGQSALKMKEVTPRTEIRRYDGYAHAQLACLEAKKWVKEVASFIEKKV